MNISREAVFHPVWISALVGFLVADNIWPTVFGPMTPAEVFDHAQERNVVVWSDDRRSFGSGFFIGPRRVVTAAHVVDDIEDGTVTVVTESGLSVETTILYVSTQTDTAILEVQADEDFAFYTFGSGARNSRLLYLYGHPHGPENDTLVSGTYAGIRTSVFSGDPATYYRTVIVAAVGPGMSGGPVVDEHGKVIGMISARWMELMQGPRGPQPVPTMYASIIGMDDLMAALEACDNPSPQNTVDMGDMRG